jgi:hypothetical protein
MPYGLRLRVASREVSSLEYRSEPMASKYLQIAHPIQWPRLLRPKCNSDDRHSL